jgi:hypothetical protein
MHLEIFDVQEVGKEVDLIGKRGIKARAYTNLILRMFYKDLYMKN